MMKRLRQSKVATMGLALVLLGLIGWADHATSEQIDLACFYLLPILLVAWRVGAGPDFVVAALSAGVSMADDLLNSHPVHPAIPYWNAAVRLATFLVAAGVVAALKYSYDRLREEQAFREDLTHMLVHDLKNPLATAAAAFADLRRLFLENLAADPRREALTTLVHESHERVQGLIEDILNVARAEGGHMPLNLAESDLAAVARVAVQEARPRAERAGIHLQERYDDGAGPVRMDAEKIRRVVDNLVANALRFTPEGGVVEVRVAPQGHEMWLTVRDSGDGIPAEQQAGIFEKFGQAGRGRENDLASVGLGLTFCHLAITSHDGGRLWVESAPGQGSAFTFALPREQ